MTNSIEPADEVMTVAAVLWVALHTGLFMEPSANIPYRYHQHLIHLEYEFM
jgi:hypothetical protein